MLTLCMSVMIFECLKYGVSRQAAYLSSAFENPGLMFQGRPHLWQDLKLGGQVGFVSDLHRALVGAAHKAVAEAQHGRLEEQLRHGALRPEGQSQLVVRNLVCR